MATRGDESTIGELDPTAPSAPEGYRAALRRGTAIGRYVIIRMIGRGGMGAVYAAHDPQLDRQIALKLLHAAGGATPESLINEAKALARLDDHHVVQVFDAGEHEGEIFIAMQLVDGEDLAHALAKRKPRIGQIIAWFVDAGRGLAAAHSAGLIHRDFKPNNVLIDRRGRVAVTDFGLALNTHDPDDSGPRNPLAGTPAYMAPEQHGMEAATEASDQFAFCVSLWEALFGQHPYVAGDRSAMSPFEIGHAIFDGTLIPPPRGSHVPRRVTEILTRGLSRAPADRWPSMTVLVAQLAPIQRRRLWPTVAVAGVVAAAASGVGMWIYLRDDAVAEPSCKAEAAERIASAWSPASAASVRARFAQIGSASAGAKANLVDAKLNQYAAHWQQLTRDVCAAERATSGALGDLLVRRRGCLDASLDGLHGVVEVLTGEAQPQVVDHASDLVAALPDLRECADSKALLGELAAPPPDIASQARQIERELQHWRLRLAVGDFVSGVPAVRALVARADALGWKPTAARTHYRLGIALDASLQPALPELLQAAELASASHMDRLAVRSWARALEVAGYAHKPEVVSTLLPIARGAATRTGDRMLSLLVEVGYAFALIQLQRWTEATPICRAAIATAQQLDDPELSDKVHDCLYEALVPAGESDELRVLVAERIATKAKLFGPDVPSLADYLLDQGEADVNVGKLAEARTEIERALTILAKVYPDRRSAKVGEALRIRGRLELAEGKPDAGVATLREGLAIAFGLTPKPSTLIANLVSSIGDVLVARHDRAGAVRIYQQAIEVTREQSGKDSIELAVLLLNYGEIASFDLGVGALGEAREILENQHDPRANYAAIALASLEVSNKHWADARKHAEEAYAFDQLQATTEPGTIADLEFNLAQAIIETHGDKKRARGLAGKARTTLVGLGPGSAPKVKEIDAWLAKHR